MVLASVPKRRKLGLDIKPRTGESTIGHNCPRAVKTLVRSTPFILGGYRPIGMRLNKCPFILQSMLLLCPLASGSIGKIAFKKNVLANGLWLTMGYTSMVNANVNQLVKAMVDPIGRWFVSPVNGRVFNYLKRTSYGPGAPYPSICTDYLVIRHFL